MKSNGGNQPVMWTKPKLENHFRGLHNPCYLENEVAGLIRLYDVDHLISRQVKDLLKATQAFLNETTLDTTFKSLREKKMDEELLSSLDKVGQALINTQAKLDEDDLNPLDQEVLSDAIQYSLKSIKLRMEELHGAGDRIDHVFHNNTNKLAGILDHGSPQKNDYKK